MQLLIRPQRILQPVSVYIYLANFQHYLIPLSYELKFPKQKHMVGNVVEIFYY